MRYITIEELLHEGSTPAKCGTKINPNGKLDLQQYAGLQGLRLESENLHVFHDFIATLTVAGG